MSLGDGEILNRTTLRSDGVEWTACFTPVDGGEPIKMRYTDKPKGAALATFCQMVRGELGERQKSKRAETASKVPTSEHATGGEDSDAAESAGGGSTTKTRQPTFEEELEERRQVWQAKYEGACAQVEDWARKRDFAKSEVEAIEGALSGYKNARSNKAPKSGRNGTLRLQKPDAGSGTSGNREAGGD